MKFVLPITLAVALCGCATAQPSFEVVVRPDIAIADAEAAGAGQSYASARHLALAERQLAEARTLLANGHGDRAAWLFERAAVDADLAGAIGRMEAARRQAQGEWRTFDELYERQAR